MLRVIAFFFFAGFAASCVAQNSTWSPLGVLVHPSEEVKVPDDIRAAIPAGMVVRWMQQTHLSSEGETALIYETGDQYETKPHIAFIRKGVRVGDFRLVEALQKEAGVSDDDFDNFEISEAAEIPLQADRKGLLAAFRNIGDGAATVFLLMTETNGKLSFAWHKDTSQAQFRIRSVGVFQVWSSDEGDNCVWCSHDYEVTNYQWKNGTLVELSRFMTKHALSPYQFSENPIVAKP